ncbi:MAG: sugar phosphate isomerase/epimerase, partial [Nanohaloarchaea archaeon SW_10_44_10]
MKLGTSLGPEGDLREKILDTPEEIEFIEFSIGEHERMPEEIDVGEVKKALDEKDFDLVVHLPF